MASFESLKSSLSLLAVGAALTGCPAKPSAVDDYQKEVSGRCFVLCETPASAGYGIVVQCHPSVSEGEARLGAEAEAMKVWKNRPESERPVCPSSMFGLSMMQ